MRPLTKASRPVLRAGECNQSQLLRVIFVAAITKLLQVGPTLMLSFWQSRIPLTCTGRLFVIDEIAGKVGVCWKMCTVTSHRLGELRQILLGLARHLGIVCGRPANCLLL